MTSKKQFRTEGIANLDENGEIIPDASPVSYTELIGKVVFCIPYLGFANKIFTSTPGAYYLLGFVFFVIAVSIILDLCSPKKKSSQNFGKEIINYD